VVSATLLTAVAVAVAFTTWSALRNGNQVAVGSAPDRPND